MAVRPGALAPSASGGLEWKDVRAGGVKSLRDVPIWREATEELGIEGRLLRNLMFLGVARELARGGQPEAFFAGVVDATREQIETCWHGAEDSWETSELRFYSLGPLAARELESPHEAAELRDVVSRFNEASLGEASVTLQTNISLWLSWKESEATRRVL